MPADTPVVGYPAHAVKEFSWDVNEWGTRTTNWRAQCGAEGASMGRFLAAGSCRRAELCSRCFPGRLHNACSMDKPIEIDPKEWK
jgi:hypothetical protein